MLYNQKNSVISKNRGKHVCQKELASFVLTEELLLFTLTSALSSESVFASCPAEPPPFLE